jgi:hypothetical protein
MKKFTLNRQYLTHIQLGYVREEIKPLACANDLNTLMKSVEDYAGKILQVRNPNFLEWKKWEVSRDGSHAEIIVISKDPSDCEDGIRFIIDEVDFLI